MNLVWACMAIFLQVALTEGDLMALGLKEIREFLYEARLKWYNIGIELDCDLTELDVIKLKHREDPTNCLTEMIRFKICDTPLTWNVIAKALSAKAVDEKKLAAKAFAKAQGKQGGALKKELGVKVIWRLV